MLEINFFRKTRGKGQRAGWWEQPRRRGRIPQPIWGAGNKGLCAGGGRSRKQAGALGLMEGLSAGRTREPGTR